VATANALQNVVLIVLLFVAVLACEFRGEALEKSPEARAMRRAGGLLRRAR
jgi:hypothetical protein